MGNIEAALAAAFPKNSWHRTFKAFKLPSPCSNRKIDRASQEQIKGMLVRLFEGAGYEEAARGRMWSQWLRLCCQLLRLAFELVSRRAKRGRGLQEISPSCPTAETP